jgi:hypothetical protein
MNDRSDLEDQQLDELGRQLIVLFENPDYYCLYLAERGDPLPLADYLDGDRPLNRRTRSWLAKCLRKRSFGFPANAPATMERFLLKIDTAIEIGRLLEDNKRYPEITTVTAAIAGYCDQEQLKYKNPDDAPSEGKVKKWYYDVKNWVEEIHGDVG